MRKDIEFGINIGYVAASVGFEPAIDMVADAGFTLLDYSPSIHRDDWEEIMNRDLPRFEKRGLRVHQTHCPFFRYVPFDEKQNLMRERIYEATVKMGAEYMVVHGDEFNIALQEYTPERAFQYNYDMFAPYVEKAEKDGIKIAFETVFADSVKTMERYGSRFEELERLVFAFKSDAAVCCWDFGHANVSFKKEHADRIRQMKGKVACTHVHDNNSHHDDHLLPFQGNIDWKACVDALNETGYNGHFVYELVYGKIPPERMPEYLNYLINTGKYICNL